MSDEKFNEIKIHFTNSKEVFRRLTQVSKTEKINNIRTLVKKMTKNHQFIDRDKEPIGEDAEEDYTVEDIVIEEDGKYKIYIQDISQQNESKPEDTNITMSSDQKNEPAKIEKENNKKELENQKIKAEINENEKDKNEIVNNFEIIKHPNNLNEEKTGSDENYSASIREGNTNENKQILNNINQNKIKEDYSNKMIKKNYILNRDTLFFVPLLISSITKIERNLKLLPK